MIELEVNSIPYKNWTSATVELRLDALSNSFSFNATSEDGNPLPFKGGESCRILVDGQTVLTGYIEIIEMNYSADNHEIVIQGRDRTSDLVDSFVTGISDLRPPIGLKQVIEKIISNIGSDLSVVENTVTTQFNAASDLPSPEPGQNAFEFCEMAARKKQVLLTSNSYGSVVITQAKPVSTNSELKHLVGNDSNNILAGSVEYNYTERFNRYKFDSALNLTALQLAGSVDLGSTVNQSGEVLDNRIRAGRQFVSRTENSSSSTDAEDRAKWEANIRKTRSIVYNATVSGFKDANGDLWNINQLATVIDSFAGINAQMLINSVRFTDDAEGKNTELELVDKNSYTTIVQEPVNDSKTQTFDLGELVGQ